MGRREPSASRSPGAVLRVPNPPDRCVRPSRSLPARQTQPVPGPCAYQIFCAPPRNGAGSTAGGSPHPGRRQPRQARPYRSRALPVYFAQCARCFVRRQALRYGIGKCNIFTCNNMKTKPWPCYMAIAIVRPGPPLLSRVNRPVGLPEAAAPARRGSRCRTPKRKRTAPASPEAQLRGLGPAGASPSHPRVHPFVSRSPPAVAQSPPSASLTLPSNNIRWCIESKSPNRFEAAKKETFGPCRRIGVPPKR